ncbi:MAG: hypothetical protein AAFP70_12605, partial [Calditrichota bacterium]
KSLPVVQQLFPRLYLHCLIVLHIAEVRFSRLIRLGKGPDRESFKAATSPPTFAQLSGSSPSSQEALSNNADRVLGKAVGRLEAISAYRYRKLLQ